MHEAENAERRRKAAEEEARLAERERQLAEEQAKRVAEEEARRKAEEEARVAERERQLAEEQAKRADEEQARRKAEEDRLLKVEEERRLVENSAKQAAEERERQKVGTQAPDHSANGGKSAMHDEAPASASPVEVSSFAGSDGAKAIDDNLTPAERQSLVRDLQTELKRVGCYEGSIDGKWGEDTRQGLG